MGPKLRVASRDWLEVIELTAVRIGVTVPDARRQVTAFISLYIGYEIFSGLSPRNADEGSMNAIDLDLLALAIGVDADSATAGVT